MWSQEFPSLFTLIATTMSSDRKYEQDGLLNAEDEECSEHPLPDDNPSKHDSHVSHVQPLMRWKIAAIVCLAAFSHALMFCLGIQLRQSPTDGLSPYRKC